MYKLILIHIFLCLVTLNALSIEKVSEKQNVTKRNANFFPDWVPFKNKHGEELGEFVSVNKLKPKKRLAPPVNFILRAVAEPEGDDYYDKGQGESEGEEDFEKKEWSDLNREPLLGDPDPTQVLNHTELSDIDGVVGIITKVRPHIVLDAIEEYNNNNFNNNITNKRSDNSSVEEVTEPDSKEENNTTVDIVKFEPVTTEKKNPKEEDIDYDDSSMEKKVIQESDQSESDAKKAIILGSVDELKERHAKEQAAISEKAREEEDHERNKYGYQSPDIDKYDSRGRKKDLEYDEYDEKEIIHEKYNPQRVTKATTTTTREPKKTTKLRSRSKYEDSGKMSVFKNPQLYMIYDDDNSDEITTISTTSKATTDSNINKKSEKYSSRYSTTIPPSDSEENIRISLVPQDTEAKEGEPTLFFPKVKKNKRKRKNKKTTTPEPDTFVAESIKEVSSKGLVTAADNHVTSSEGSSERSSEVSSEGSTEGSSEGSSKGSSEGTTATGTDSTAYSTGYPTRYTTALSGLVTAPSTIDGEATSSMTVTDAQPASTDHQNEKKPESYMTEKGGGKENHAEHSEEHEEHGKKAYEGVHENTKTSKGHHDKEDHHGDYHDHGGHDKSHDEKSSHYGDHNHEEHGKKHAKYEESGKHSKGHSTKGSHDIHKKEEYEKKVEFFEEEGDSTEEEKHGGYHDEKEHKKGGHFTKGNLDAKHHRHKKGESGHFQKGAHLQGIKSHKAAGGHDNHSKTTKSSSHKEGKEGGKKWIYHHGHPAKTANLYLLDRRVDQYHHGPSYYG